MNEREHEVNEGDYEMNEGDHEMNEGNQSFSSYGEQIISISEDQSMLVLEDDQRNLLEMNSNEYISETTFDDILKESEAKTNADFPNEAYADLMALVTKHNLRSEEHTSELQSRVDIS